MTYLKQKLFTPQEFEAVFERILIRTGNTRGIIYAYHVEGKLVSKISEEFQCTNQNTVKALSRFAAAYERFQQVKLNLAVDDSEQK